MWGCICEHVPTPRNTEYHTLTVQVALHFVFSTSTSSDATIWQATQNELQANLPNWLTGIEIWNSRANVETRQIEKSRWVFHCFSPEHWVFDRTCRPYMSGMVQYRHLSILLHRAKCSCTLASLNAKLNGCKQNEEAAPVQIFTGILRETEKDVVECAPRKLPNRCIRLASTKAGPWQCEAAYRTII